MIELTQTSTGLALHDPDDPKKKPLLAAPHALDTRSGPGRSLASPLAKAVGLRSGEPRPRVADTTAGLGEDSWLLAAAGCEVLAIERHPTIHALLADGLRRAEEAEPDVEARITLVLGESIEVLNQLDPAPEVILIDPMFPERKKSAKEKKAMRWLRRVVGPDLDAAKLLAVARSVTTGRVVVKRPAHAPRLADDAVAEHGGRGFRWDVYRGD